MKGQDMLRAVACALESEQNVPDGLFGNYYVNWCYDIHPEDVADTLDGPEVVLELQVSEVSVWIVCHEPGPRRYAPDGFGPLATALRLSDPQLRALQAQWARLFEIDYDGDLERMQRERAVARLREAVAL